MASLIWVGIGFFAGSLPFSVWVGRVVLGTEIRAYGDGNPGAANAWRAGRWRAGAPALVLDYLKGAVPVSLAHYGAGITGWALTPVALAPILGHIFSPWLHFRGGKGLAVTFGAWTGLTFLEGPTVLGLLFTFFYFIVGVDAWAALLGLLGLGVYLTFRGAAFPLLAAWAGNTALLAWTHRSELRRRLVLRPEIAERLRRR